MRPGPGFWIWPWLVREFLSAIMTKSVTMDDLLKDVELDNISASDFIEGKIISIQKHEVWLDIGHLGVGVVSRRELVNNSDLEVGQTVTASVVHPETKHGHALLSLRRVMKDKSWEEIQKIYDNNQIVSVNGYDANRGGLLVEFEGIRGFLPISQLSINHYPRVNSSDKEEVVAKLNQLIGKSIKVCILDLNRKENKLIFSEKEALKEVVSEQLKKLSVGDVVDGVVTGVTHFGAFVNIDGVEGLIHISEISWGRVEDPHKHVKVGETVKVKIISIVDERVALSLKQLTDDPWEQEVKGLKEGSEVEGVITRTTPYGAFVRISPVVEALLYLFGESQTEDGEGGVAKTKATKTKPDQAKIEDLKKNIKVGDTKQFVIVSLDKEARKISLKLK